MLVACRLAGLSALEGTTLTTPPKRNLASKSNRSDAVLDRLTGRERSRSRAV